MEQTELAEHQAAAALAAIGAEVMPQRRRASSSDLTVEIDGRRFDIQIKTTGRLQRAGTVESLRDVLDGAPASTGAELVLVVADRVDPVARRELRSAGLGYLDLAARHLTLRAPGLIVDADVELDEHLVPTTDRGLRNPFTAVGLQVAFRALRHPTVAVPVRATASALGVSATQVSAVCRALADEGLLDEQRTIVEPPELFWALAEHWRSPPELRASRPRAQLAGAVSVGDEAALHWGAPVVITLGDPLLHLASARFLPPPAEGEPAARVTVAPAPEAAEAAVDDPFQGLIAGPLAVALQLAQDRGRGREVLSEWTPPSDVQERVW